MKKFQNKHDKVRLGFIVSLFALIGIFTMSCGDDNSDNNNGNNNGSDTTAPSISNGLPSGVLLSTTTSALLSITTDEDATCRYADTQGVDYSAMPDTLPTTGGTFHSTMLSDLQNEQSYNYYLRCQDTSGNANTDDYLVAFSVAGEGEAIYVDQTLIADITNGAYSKTNRDNSGSDGNAYTSIQAAVDAMNEGDDIYIRGGTYNENVLLSGSTAPDGTANNYASMQSYPGEWAIIDGQGIEQYTIGTNRNGREPADDLAYWKFERLEITGGAGSDGGGGLMIHGGPFIIRYNYIHDNLNAYGGNNPGGIVGYTWTDSIVEYNYLHNNGMSSGTDGNAANILIFGDYQDRTTAETGFANSTTSTRRNEIRYNYFSGSSVGFKHKGSQLFTGRNPGTSDYDDTYKDWGDKIHHNYFVGQRRIALLIEQDFAQAYNNIFDSVPDAINVNYEPNFQLYKVVTYNNTIWNALNGIKRYGCKFFEASFVENESHYGQDYNNIIDSSDRAYAFWFTGTAINIFNGCGTYNPTYDNPDISNYFSSHNYFYRPDDPDIFSYGSPTVFYTAAEFETQIETGTPRVAYTNPYDGGNLLYAGTTDADKYITRGAHVVRNPTTIANGGVGGPHPYLSGVTLPSYVGATNPDDNAWVAGVLSLTDVNVLKAGSSGDPDWVEK